MMATSGFPCARLLGVALLSLAGCHVGGCSPCPDLAQPALQITLVGSAGDSASAANVTYDIEQVKTPAGTTTPFVQTGIMLGVVPNLPAGRYKVTLRRGREVVGSVDDFCTAGGATGCAAETAASQGYPKVTANLSVDPPVVHLDRNGPCP